MAVLLSLETSTAGCSVALHDNGRLCAEVVLDVPQSASSQLAVMIRDVLAASGISPRDLSGVAVAAGPGSYTGLRIGTATAKGLCYALGVPLFSVNTLELLVQQVVTSGVAEDIMFLCPMLDARRMEVYCLMADRAGNGVEPTTAKVIDASSFTHWLERGRVLFFGNGAAKCREVIGHPNAVFLSGIVPLAAAMGELVFRKFTSGEAEDLSAFEPLYLKDFVVKKPKVSL